MCGIAGEVRWRGRAHSANLTPALDAIAHRGPDRAGTWSDEVHCALGFRRLAIIDLSPAGNQPMTNEDCLVWLVFRWRVFYNFQSLRDRLAGLGHRFAVPQTDTKVIVHAYEQWGAECVHRLRGMFAFALWDSNRRTLFMARDRVGKKPLFYWLGPTGIAFAVRAAGIAGSPRRASKRR